MGPTQPQSFVHGTVRYTDGNPVERALVLIEGGDRTFTSGAGTYRLQLPVSGTVIRVLAYDGYTPGRSYAVIHSGSVEFPRQPGVVADVVLDHGDPI